MKINSKIFRGIEYIELNELPQPQRDLLNHTMDHNLFIKIMIDGKIVSHCLQYKDYCFWYKNVYQAAAAAKVQVSTPEVKLKPELAFK